MLPIEVSRLQKNFGTLKAVDGISFNVKEGEVFGLLGPNGAG
jgi:ABC-type multidrug transport system ATPase subunit